MTSELDKRLAGLSPEKRALLEKKLKQKAAEKAMEKVRKQHIPPRQGEGPWPASMDQTALWFFHQLDPDFYAYNNGPTIHLRGNLKIPLFEQAATELLRRHEILRTVFFERDGKLYQQPVKDPTIRCPITDFSGEPEATRMDRAHEEITRLFREPFDMGVFPLIRFQFIKLDEDDYLLPLVAHHAIIDWWTLKLIPRELLTIYQAFVNGMPSPLPEIPVQFIDYTLWRNNWLASADFQKQLSYWLKQLEGAPLVMDLPTDRPRPAQQDFSGERLYRRMPQELLQGIRKINVRKNASSLMTCMAGTFAFLYRYSGQKDLLIGTPTTDRERKELENMAGYMLNILVIRADLSEDPTFADFVGQMKGTILDALANKELPFRILVEKLSPERDLSHMPIYQVDFNHVSIEGPVFERHDRGQYAGLSLPGFEISGYPMDRGISDVDLQINYDEGMHEGRIVMEWASALFDSATAEHMGDLLVRLFTNLTRNPDTPISQVSWLDDEEKKNLLVAWNGSKNSRLPEQSLSELFAETAAAHAETVALVHNGRETTYSDLNARTNRLARYLAEQNVTPGDPVGLCLEKGVDWITAMLAILRIGGAYVPVDPAYPKDRIAFMMEDTGMSVLLTHRSVLPHLPGEMLASRHILVMDEAEETLSAFDASSLPNRVPSAATACILYTSGTMGRPKGVLLPHRGITRLVYDHAFFAGRPGQGMTQTSNIGFDAHLFEVFATLLHGSRLCIVDREALLEPADLVDLVATQKITAMFLTTALLNQFARDKPELFSGLEYLLFGGERAEPEALRRILAAGGPKRLHNIYGPTEGSSYTTWYAVDTVDENAHQIPIGKPFAHTRVYVLDPGGQLAPVGVIGELCIAGVSLAAGYQGDPAKTAVKFAPNPYAPKDAPGDRIYRTGDLVKRLRDGNLVFHGRADSQVKLRGFRIEPGEIETVLNAHEDVGEALVRLHDNVNRLAAYVVPKQDRDVDTVQAAVLLDYLGKRLPEYMIPASITVLEAFPLTPNGKIDTKALPVPGTEADNGLITEPRNKNERILAEIWAEALNLPKVGIHDNFFALGGDSIMGIQTIAAANRRGLALSTKHLFRYQTIADLAVHASMKTGLQAEQGTVTGEAPLSPIQHRHLYGNTRPGPYFNMSINLSVSEILNPNILKRSLDRITAHHDALRARFAPGSRVQRFEGLEGKHYGFHHIDLSDRENPLQALIEAAQTRQAEVDQADGPLMQVTLAEMPAGQCQRLVITTHHLVFDGVSSRILVEDLETVYSALARNEEPALMPKTTSWKHWCERLQNIATGEEVTAQMPWWLERVSRPAALLPVIPDAPKTVSTTRTIHLTLTEEETSKLLQQVPSAYNTRIDDVLLCALVTAVAGITKNDKLIIAMEGHGREDLFDDVDITRTIGWFTAMYPVLLDLQGNTDCGNALKTIKEQLRQIPLKGLGYGLLRHLNENKQQRFEDESKPQISFNYLGRFGGSGGQGESLLSFTGDGAGSDQPADAERAFPLEIVAVSAEERINLFYSYSGEMLDTALVEDLAHRHLTKLRNLIEHCLQPGAGGRTPSDFPMVEMTQAEVDRLLLAHPQVDAVYPAMGLQAGMLFHAAMSPHSTVYKQQLSMFLPGSLDVECYQQAWQQVIDRHESLRTLFVESDRGFLQVVLHRWQPPWTVSAVNSRDEFKALAHTQLIAEQQLDRAPASRFGLYTQGDEGAWFLWTHHHVNLDGWSIPVIMDEVSTIYLALKRGEAAALPPAIPYEDYVRWFQSQDPRQAENHWRVLLEDFDQPTLLAQKPPVKDAVAQVKTIEQTLNEKTSADVDAFARANGLTMSTLFSAVWALALGRYLNRRDVVFGVTGSGRPPELQGVERLVGMFLNTLPIRLNLDPTRPLSDWLKDVQQLQAEGRQYEYSILPDIQQLADVEPAESLFDSIVVYENYPVDTSLGERFGDEGIGELDLFEESNYPISLQSGPGRNILLRIRYDAGRFTDQFAESFLKHVAALMANLPKYAQENLGDIPMLTAEETAGLHALSGGRIGDPGRESLIDRFASIAETHAEQPAVIAGGTETTYGQLAVHANRIAHALRARGVRTGHTVAVCLEEDNPDLPAAFLGVLTAGAAYVPLDGEMPEARLRTMIAAAAPFCLIGGGALTFHHGLPVLPRLDELENYPETRPPVTLDANLPAYIMYTSGSTGNPKGVVVPHRGIIRLVCDTGWIQFQADDVVLQTSIPTFDAATFEIWGTLLHGAKLVLMSSRDIESIPARVLSEGVTVIYLNAQLFNLLVDSGLRERGALRLVMTGGDAASPGHVARFREAFPGLTLLNGYGPTENTTFTTSFDLAAYRGPDTPIGRPVTNTYVRVLDDTMNPMPPAATGELMTGGDGLASGYLNDPALTAQKFVPDPFADEPGSRLYRTGDLAAFRPDGVLDFYGRRDHQVKLRGYRIELGEIEKALRDLPGVADALVRMKTFDSGDKRLVAWVCGRDDDSEGAAHAVREALTARLPEYMVPSAFAFLDSLPMKPNGKIDMASLPDPETPGADYTAPETPTQERIAAVWSRLLGLPRISITANIFELGAHSLTATRAVSMLRNEFDVELKLKTLFESPTIAEQAKLIDLMTWSREAPNDEDGSDDMLTGEI
ncbi:MAG: amino acid adenylation domain-containing protein [Acidobacteriota bacterium]|nr:amino acid adenylation domain-containing protein [Acidobacteriota bacterium]